MICRKIQIFLKILAFLSQLKRNKESENITVVLRFSPKQAKCNSFRTLFGTLRCVSFCILLYLYAPLCISWFLCTFLWRFAVFPSAFLSCGANRSCCAVAAQQLLYKKHKKEAAAQKYATASHNSGYAIEQCSGTGDHRAAFAASICLISSGTTLNRSPTMP